ncbi:MAG TPA: choice-of-anchor D domain-containing protein [Thermoanaerobaculia bacterium]|nr:choice-of-anchor D domain-containing protein [Thermoanaerobaculia bacterium]
MTRSKRFLITTWLLSTLAAITSASASSFLLKVDSRNANAGSTVTVPVRLQESDASAGALAFVVAYDATRLALRPSGQEFALPAPAVPPSFQISSYSTVEGDVGRVGIVIFDPHLPMATIPSGVITDLVFNVLPGADGFAFVRIDSLTKPSASDAVGNDIPYAGKQDGGITITPNRAILSVEPATVGFGSVPLGSAAERLLIIANSGTAPLSISRISVADGPFRVSSFPVPLVLNPGASLSLTVNFASTAPGTFASVIKIESGGSSLEIPLTAAATEGQSFSYSERFLLPAAARVPGANGSQWRTRLTMFNRDQFTAGLRLRYLASTGETEVIKEYVLAPDESRRIDDVISDLGLEQGNGAIEIDLSTPEIVLTSSTYNVTTRGGQTSEAVPLVSWSDLFHTGRRVALIGLDRSAARRTSVTLMNLSAKAAVLTVDLRDESGRSLGKRDYQLQAGQILSGIDIFELLAGLESKDLTLVISTITADATFYAFASIVDNETGAPLYEEAR